MRKIIGVNQAEYSLILLAATAAATGLIGTPKTAAANQTIKVGYSSSYVFDEDADSVICWDRIKEEFEAVSGSAMCWKTM